MALTPRRSPFLLAACALALGLAACGDRGTPVSAGTPPPGGSANQPSLLGSVRCTADPRAKTLSCGAAELPSSARGYIIVGGQHDNVNLTSSNVTYDSQSGAFAFDVTVQNLIPQAMGTTDGVTPDANGVRVVFATGPTVTSGSGNASVANADGTGTFTNTNQPYFQYSGTTDLGPDQLLTQNETSGAKNWQLTVDNTVGSFAFTLYVVTEVQFPNGYVQITGNTPNVLAGGGEALTATVRQPTGKLSGNQSVTWGSTNTSVATVDGSGNVTAVAPGVAQITATQGSLSASASIAVCPNLAVGDVYVAGADAASICFAGGASGKAEYTYMPMNLSQSSALSSFGVTGGTGIDSALVTPKSPNPDRLGVGGLPLRPLDVVAGSDLPILEKDLPKMNALLKNPSSRIRSGRRTGGFRGIITQNALPSVGDSMDLNTNSACSGSPSVRRGVVRSVSQHLVIVGDTANPAGGFTTAQYDSIALEFDTLAWKVDSANFGLPTDVDGNGHVVAFFTRAVNELSPPASSSVVLGFFASKDVFDTTAVNGCTNSNMGEMFYMLVPDPTGVVNSNVRTVSFVRGNTTGTLGHEFQHMINAFRRAYVTNASFFEQGFLNEGLSHIAEELMFYQASGMSPRLNIRLGTDPTNGIQLNTKRVAAFNAYANQNFGRFKGWISRPDTTGAFKQNQNSLAVRGAIWAFLRYSADRVNGNDQTFWYNMVNSNLEGLPNIQNAIGADPNTWLRDFMAAMYADDNSFSVATQYRTPSWNYRNLYSALGGFTLQIQPLNNGMTKTVTYGSGGSTQYFRFAVASGAFGTVTTSALPATPFGLVVVRTR
jgi:hypothetical protein